MLTSVTTKVKFDSDFKKFLANDHEVPNRSKCRGTHCSLLFSLRKTGPFFDGFLISVDVLSTIFDVFSG